MIQFVVQVVPASKENRCDHRAEVDVMSPQSKRTMTGRPSRTSSHSKTPRPSTKRPTIGGSTWPDSGPTPTRSATARFAGRTTAPTALRTVCRSRTGPHPRSQAHRKSPGADAGGDAPEAILTYRISQIRDLQPLDERFTRPDGFDLAAHWRRYLDEFEARRHRGEAVVRLSPHAIRSLPDTMSAAVVRAVGETGTPTEPAGWARAVIPIESVPHAAADLLRLGVDVEVLEPADLREHITATVTALAERYKRDRADH